VQNLQNFIELSRLRYRANRYKNRHDKGGILFLISSIGEGQTVMDIGAHKAGYTYWMIRQLGRTGMVYAFEPQSHLYDYIARIKAISRWDNVKVENIALSDETTTATLRIPHSKPGKKSSPGATIIEGGREFTGLTQTVGTDSLDSYCSRNGIAPDFLKIDVEGNELKIFRGGINTLKTSKPKILVEIESRHAGKERAMEAFDFLKSLGYSGHFIKGSERIPLASFSFESHQNLRDMKNYCNNFTFEHSQKQKGTA
jgi:FkbM family methyltransferase